MVHLLGKIFQWFLKNFNRVLLYDPAILLPEVYPKELKTGTQTSTCTYMLIHAAIVNYMIEFWITLPSINGNLFLTQDPLKFNLVSVWL